MHICTHVKYRIAIIHATEPLAASPTGNRAKINYLYRQLDCIHRRFHRQPVHKQPVHRQLSQSTSPDTDTYAYM